MLTKKTIKTLECGTHIRKLSLKDDEYVRTRETDTDKVAALILCGVCDENGSRVYKSIDEISEFDSDSVAALAMEIGEFNKEAIEKKLSLTQKP